MKIIPIFFVFALSIVSTFAAEDKTPPEVVHPPEVVSEAQIKALPAHPRLMVNAARFTELRQLIKTSDTHRELFGLLRRNADDLLKLPPVEYKPKHEGDNFLAIIREAELRIFTLAMMFRLTDEKPYLEGARAVLDDLAAQNLPTSHFLDPSTLCLSLSIGYDWLYDELTPAERETIATKIKSLVELTTTNPEQLSFLWATFNWNQICNSCMTIGALAIGDREPTLAQHMVNRTIAMIPRAAAAYAPDGLYPEGPGYWAYGTSYHVMMIETLRSSLGSSENLEKFPGFLASASVIDQLTGPTGKLFNYFDNHAVRYPQNLVFWFARETGRSDITDAELVRVKDLAKIGDPKYGRSLPLGLLWAAPTTTASAPKAPLHWQAEGHQPVAVLRSVWGDPNATWLAIKGGTADYSHGHMDAGSFVLEALGVRWALDPDIEDYLEVRSRTGLTHGQFFSYAQDSARWKHFRLGPEGHNLLRFNGERQNVNGHATIAPIKESAEGASVEVNLDSTYQGQAVQVRRQVTLRPDNTIVIDDSWTAGGRATEVCWQWLTQAKATTEADGVRLEQDGKTLHLRVANLENVQIELQTASELMNPIYDGVSPGWTRIVIRQKTPADKTGHLQVKVGADVVE